MNAYYCNISTYPGTPPKTGVDAPPGNVVSIQPARPHSCYPNVDLESDRPEECDRPTDCIDPRNPTSHLSDRDRPPSPRNKERSGSAIS